MAPPCPTLTFRAAALAGLVAAGSAFGGPAPKAAPAASPAGSRDLSGVWTNAWYTHLQRPSAFKGLTATPAEADAFEAPRRAHKGELIDPAHDTLGQAESEFPDNGPGLARIAGEIRTSWIVEPADGRIPWRAEALKRLPPDEPPLDNVEQRDTDERCLTNSSATAPLLNSHDGNVLEIVQGGDAVAIVGEKNHEVRIVRLGDPDAAPSPAETGMTRWTGVSVGRWEGATLVVVTTRLRPGLTKLDDGVYLSDHARVVERFTRTGPAEIRYRFEVTDESLFTRPWRGEQVWRPEPRGIFEYACHEGNYALPSILRAARAAERQSKPEVAAK